MSSLNIVSPILLLSCIRTLHTGIKSSNTTDTIGLCFFLFRELNMYASIESIHSEK